MKFDLSKLSREMSRIQDEFKQIQNKIRIESSSGGGMVKAVADGHGNIVSIKIEPELLKDDIDIRMLEDLIIAAVNEAKNAARTEAQKEMQKIIGIPLDGFLSRNLF